MPDEEARHHHGSHRGLLRPAADPGPSGPGIDAVIVPTARPPVCLAAAAELAEALGCPLVTLHSTNRASASEALRRLSNEVELVAIDVPDPGRLRLPDWETSRLLAGTVFARRTDVSAKRNLALMLSDMLGWSRVLFLDDDIVKLDQGDVRRAGRLLDSHSAVGLYNEGYPDNSVVCHAYRLSGGSQSAFVGAGALAVELDGSPSFFPDIYNDDWFFLVDSDMRLRSTTATGHVYQHPYDPFQSPARARSEELGDVLAEGLFCLLDGDLAVTDADAVYWAVFLARRRRFIVEVQEMVAAAIEPGEEKVRMIAALNGSLGRLAMISPELCEQFMKAWARDRQRWVRHLELLPAGMSLIDALPLLSRAGSPPLNWRRGDPPSPRPAFATSATGR
jgi:hypothetical protein